MEVEELIRKHISNGQMMQLATQNNNQPWCCSVFYVYDKALNLYWISTPERRHSLEIEENSKVAATIPIKHMPGQKVVGVQLEGVAELVEDRDEVKRAIRLYANRFNTGDRWYDDFVAGKNKHKLYHIKPHLFVLFDEEAFPDDTRKEWRPKL